MEWLATVRIDQVVGYTTLAIIALLVISRKLIWYKDQDKVIAEKDEWKTLALRLLTSTEKTASQMEALSTIVKEDSDHEIP